MKKIFTFLLTSSLCLSGFAQDLELPVPSPLIKMTQRIGLTDVDLEYSRPRVKGREVFGGLEPFNEVWRTGANRATKISFSTDVKVGGNDVPAGTYALFTIPNPDKFTFILNKNYEQWGKGDYKQEEDVARIDVDIEKADNMESMLIYFDNVKDESADLILHWSTTSIRVPIAVEVQSVAKKNIENAIDEAENSFRTYNSAARYYLDNNLDAAQALKWARKSVDMDKRFWNLTTLSRAYGATGNKEEAIKLAEEAMAMAEEMGYQRYVKMNADNLKTWKEGE